MPEVLKVLRTCQNVKIMQFKFSYSKSTKGRIGQQSNSCSKQIGDGLSRE